MVIAEQLLSDSSSLNAAVDANLHAPPVGFAPQNLVVDPLQEEALLDANALVIVPYQPPVIKTADIVDGMVRVVFGLSLPPEILWRRTFESVFHQGDVFSVPRPICLPLLQPIVLPKR
ncbi:hypothetical protein D1007_38075 [Hordeum vulgare]|nr:hypothetical protein D1007_38075 [Hordeum vulgare]